jgi:Holliday junction DNA helicase RuvA
MIGSLRGAVLERGADTEVLLEVAGVGYLVTVTPRTLAELEPGATVFLHVHHHIREDAQTLFGFLRREERATFQILIATHGVGPALAMAILGTHTLKNRLNLPVLDPIGVAHNGSVNSTLGDVREALSGLGYAPDEVRDALRELPGSGDAATLLREALQLLGARRA